MNERRVWSYERDEIIEREWPAGTAVADILAQLNAIPGQLILPAQISRRAMKLGVQRPAREPNLAKLSDMNHRPISAGFPEVKEWARDRGIRFDTWEDLPGVNDARERVYLPTFKRAFPTKGRFG